MSNYKYTYKGIPLNDLLSSGGVVTVPSYTGMSNFTNVAGNEYRRSNYDLKYRNNSVNLFANYEMSYRSYSGDSATNIAVPVWCTKLRIMCIGGGGGGSGGQAPFGDSPGEAGGHGGGGGFLLYDVTNNVGLSNTVIDITAGSGGVGGVGANEGDTAGSGGPGGGSSVTIKKTGQPSIFFSAYPGSGGNGASLTPGAGGGTNINSNGNTNFSATTTFNQTDQPGIEGGGNGYYVGINIYYTTAQINSIDSGNGGAGGSSDGGNGSAGNDGYVCVFFMYTP
jgi:hypothetical protein